MVLAGILISTPVYPSSISTPRDLSNWLIKNFKYEFDKNDYWKSPRETIRDKRADCEDFAILSKYILGKKGYKVYLIAITYKNFDRGHAIAVIKNKDNTYSFMSNRYYFPTKYKTIRELLDNHRLSSTWKNAWLVINRKIWLPFWRNK